MLDLSKAKTTNALRNVLFVIWLIAVPASWFLVFHTRAPTLFNGPKAWELTTQFLLVAVIGGAVGLAYRLWESMRAKEDKQNEQQRETMAAQRAVLNEFDRSLVALHHDYKKIRRSLRASTLQQQGELFIERLTYENLMDRLEECQLRAESLKRSVDVQKELFVGRHERLSAALRSVENYLRKLLKPYEENFELRRNLGSTDLLKLDEKVTTFMSESADGDLITVNLFEPTDLIRSVFMEEIEKRYY